MENVITRINELVQKSGKKPAQIVRELGISNSAFTDWGKGKGRPNIDALVKLSDYFDVSVDYLLKGKEFKSADNNPVKTFGELNAKQVRLLEKFDTLPAEYQERAISYIDGMLAIIPAPEEKVQ